MAILTVSSTEWAVGQTYQLTWDQDAGPNFYYLIGVSNFWGNTPVVLWSYNPGLGTVLNIPYSIVFESDTYFEPNYYCDVVYELAPGGVWTTTIKLIRPIPSSGLYLVIGETDGLTQSAPYTVVEVTKITASAESGSTTALLPEPIVPPRPDGYDPDLGWDEANSVWIPTSRGGGRYRQQLIAVGKDGEIYYGGA